MIYIILIIALIIVISALTKDREAPKSAPNQKTTPKPSSTPQPEPKRNDAVRRPPKSEAEYDNPEEAFLPSADIKAPPSPPQNIRYRTATIARTTPVQTGHDSPIDQKRPIESEKPKETEKPKVQETPDTLKAPVPPIPAACPVSATSHNAAELSYLRSRGVQYLIHFTPVENLLNIMKYGILPVQTLQSVRIPYITSDPYRLDGMEYASCFSLSYPNYRYFYRIRQNRDYAVLRIDLSVLASIPENRISYFRTNAASNENRNRFEQCHGLPALQKLFQPLPTMTREAQMIPSRYTTDPQAEVVIADTIPPQYIREIHVETLRKRDAVRAALQNLLTGNGTAVVCSMEFFNARSDYRIWKAN